MPQFVPIEELFKGRHFDQDIVILCVRWYLSFKLSYRDLVTMMGERGIVMAHTTILRWVQHYSPEFERTRIEHKYVGVRKPVVDIQLLTEHAVNAVERPSPGSCQSKAWNPEILKTSARRWPRHTLATSSQRNQ